MRYDDFLKFEKIVESCGWSHFDSNFVQDEKGHYWCRYNMEKSRANAVPLAELQARLKAATKKENVDFGTCWNRYAPEIVHHTILVKETARFRKVA